MTSPQPLQDSLGDRYTLDRELGRGGMATVYLAEDVRHRRRVALKVLHPELSAVLGPDRFLKEIELTANLQHPHILALFDSGSAAGQLFYVMPFIEGETLRTRLERETQLPVDDALRIAREVADALAYAHERGVIHRDIKPENILLQSGHALVADFGIALAVQQAGGQRMTQTGLSLGTPQYMAPEQAMGEKAVDQRADIYALAAVIYEMLTGEPPHTGPSAQAIVAKVLTEPVRPARGLRAAVPQHVDNALQVALEKLPADRYSSVQEFSEALRGGTSTRTPVARAASGAPRTVGQRRSVVVGAVALAVVALGLGWVLGRSRPTAEASVPPLVVPLAIPLASETGVGGHMLAISPDGTMLALPGSDSLGASQLVVHGLAGQRNVVLGIGFPLEFSPNGRLLAFAGPDGFRVVPVAGGTSLAVGAGFTGLMTGGRGLTWLDDSTVAFAGSGTRGLVRARIGSPAVDSLRGTAQDSLAYGTPTAVTGDLILVSRGMALGSGEIGTYSVSSLAFRPLGIRGRSATYIDPGMVLFLSDATLWGVEVDPQTMVPRGAPRAVVDGQLGGRVVSFAATRSGVLVVRRSSGGSGRHLVVRDRATGLVREVRQDRLPYRSVRFSPDGNRILYSLAVRASVGGDLYVTDVGDGNTVRITSDSSTLAPEWTRDGRWIVYATIRRQLNARSYLMAVDAAGGGVPDTLLSSSRSIYEIEVTPDGRRLLWREDAGPYNRDIRSAAPHRGDSTRPERATRFDERGIALSPDGQWYLYTSNETNRSEVYLSRLGGDGARWPVSNSGGTEPRWSRNGEVFYRTADSVYATRITLGPVPKIEPPRALFADRSYYVGLESVWDVSPDGKQFVFVKTEEGSTTLNLMLNWIPGWRKP